MLQSKFRLYEIRPTMQASYTIGLGATMQENQPAPQIAARHNISPQMAPYVENLFGAGRNRSWDLSHGRRDSYNHNTTDVRDCTIALLNEIKQKIVSLALCPL